ncbi:DMT family transporter [Pseudonocardiaceae bacterium YIM PH 21723]|nr:DMT family transporter [Pseudonocardiaceae bacterium YIM PH 21723]
MTYSQQVRGPGSGRLMSTPARAVLGVLGAGLLVFGLLSITRAVPFADDGLLVGLPSAAVLGSLCMVAGGLLIVSAFAGVVPSTLCGIFGLLLVLFGIADLVVFAGRWQNIVISLGAGVLVSALAFVRWAPGRDGLSDRQERAVRERLSDIDEIAKAEHAVAEGEPTARQQHLVSEDREQRAAQERDRAYRQVPQDDPARD